MSFSSARGRSLGIFTDTEVATTSGSSEPLVPCPVRGQTAVSLRIPPPLLNYSDPLSPKGLASAAISPARWLIARCLVLRFQAAYISIELGGSRAALISGRGRNLKGSDLICARQKPGRQRRGEIGSSSHETSSSPPGALLSLHFRCCTNRTGSRSLHYTYRASHNGQTRLHALTTMTGLGELESA
ncbi:hypothetical protein Bbelb_123000 [Branchiostoma belcheri]|nr:hypothetical protein Bbelb_123000 [Branchiostoma belcheri]